MSKAVVVQQIHRKDILENMLSNISLSGKELFELIVKEKFNKKPCTESRQGFLFEAVCEILISLKCVENLNYTEINNGQLQSLKKVNNIIDLLKENVSKGSNLVDMTIKQNGTLIPFTIKYKSYYDKNLKKKNSETDVSKIDNTIVKQNISDDYKIGLIVKDKEMVLNHRYKNKMNIDKQLHDKIIENGLCFDEKDIIKALDVFCQRFSDNVLSLKKFIEFINKEYLSSSRQQLTKKLHQKMTELKFIGSFSKGSKKFCIAHKPRSGKSITILSISKYLLENGYKKILVMTSVPATIDSFIGDLEKYIDFTNISYKLQEEFGTIDENFSGLVFCSVQYLKTNVKVKKNLLKKIGFEAIIIDESHQGSSTNKTKAEILDVDTDIEDIRKTIKVNIFASGTADKTKKYYRIPNSCVYEWEIEDEAFMKELNNPDVNKKEILEYMVSRHGNTFTECFEDETLNQDYSKYPTQVLMKYSIPNSLVDEIKRYNMVNGTNFGYSCSSLFALKQTINKKGEVKYVEEFELCKTNDGEEILKGFFQFIISNNKNDKTMMKEIEMTQTSRNSRKSTKENPMLFIVYLPTHTGNNTISLLQKTIKAFLEKHKLWEHYTIEYSNSLEDSGNVKEEYNEYIQTIMDKTKKSKKIGCILLLGNKGSVGITYSDCDVTISLDDGHNLDNQKQRFSRALTEAEGKTIGINIDMNIQRTYLYLIELIQKHRRNTKTTKTNAEILYYLFEHNIFLFDPQNFKNGKIKMVDILSYFEREVEKIMKEIDDTPFLEELICDDTMREFILTDFQKGSVKKINGDIQGEQLDCPKGDKTKTEIDGPEGHSLVEKEKMEILINQTLEMCKSFLFPLLALISKSYNIFDFKDIFTDEKTSELIVSLLKDKKIDLEPNNYIIIKNIMNTIIDNNSEIVNNIREIYKIASADKIRELIKKHFIPTNDEKKQNAEVPTPVELVDEMLNVVPVEYWKTPRKVFEPCCGKGNFVLGIFDKFYMGLEELYPDKIERCRVIMKECIYYADLTAMNVFITTEIMKCHVQSYCKLEQLDFEQLDFEFNHYTGDTLELDVCKKWTNGFEAVVGNPPYNSSGNTATGNTIWQYFTKKSLNKWLLPNGYLLFVHPPGWRKPNTERGKFTKMFDLMTKQNQMIYLEIHGIKDGQKVFNCGTRYDWYLVEKKRRYKNTIVIDEEGKKNVVELGELSWLPNSNILEINKILARDGDEKCPIMYDRTAYGADKKDRVSSVETKEFKYPCIHSTPKSGIRYMYSKVNNRGHFGVSKVIFGDSGIYKPVIDMDGKYGMTQHSMAIMVDSLEEANNICKAINSDKFDNIIKSCLFSSYAIDWNIFKEFKKDFWKGYI